MYENVENLNDIEQLSKAIGEVLIEQACTVSAAESCTGGLVMKYLSDIPGSSRYLAGGVVSYSNEVKNSLLGVPQDILDHYGAVSEQTAQLMAQGVKRITGTSFGIGITGIAGPDGGSELKPVGLVYIAVCGPESTEWQKYTFPGSRSQVRNKAAEKALNMFRKHLMLLQKDN